MSQTNFQSSMHEVLKIAVASRTAEIAHYVSIETGNIVQAGPFKGMILPEAHSWGTGDISAKLLGTYECELHPAIEKAIARGPEVVFNVGAAEGYYAVGLAMRLRKAKIVAIDTDLKSHDIIHSAASDNGCTSNLCIEFFLGPSTFYEWKGAILKHSLFVMDVEGAELDIIDDSMVKTLVHTDLIVECHEFKTPGATLALSLRLAATHDLEIITEGPRNPHAIPILQKLCSLDKSLATGENRPCTMNWLVAWAKDRA